MIQRSDGSKLGDELVFGDGPAFEDFSMHGYNQPIDTVILRTALHFSLQIVDNSALGDTSAFGDNSSFSDISVFSKDSALGYDITLGDDTSIGDDS